MRKIALITGASSGLGAGMAREFATRNYDLALCARRVDKLVELKESILVASPNTRIEVAALDVNDYQSVFESFRNFHAAFGRLDVVIVNAGIAGGAAIGKSGFSDNLAIIETNLCGALAQAEAAMEIFRERQQGHLVFVSSVSAVRGMRGSMCAYASSKAGLASLAEGVRQDVMRKPNIRVTTLFPGYIRSQMNEGVADSKTPFIVSTEKGCRLMVDAVIAKKNSAYIPWWPWRPLSILMRILPLSVVSRMT